ncbi:MAG TPA: hypothetical protein VN920_16360, partial [Pyrinomonadaceae bacterium]|nr:hypothetical protein [Pyrinomonadaceae bacterium]
IQQTSNLTVTSSQQSAPQKAADQSVALKRALDYLSRRVDEIDEPYLLAAYVLASFDAGAAARAAPAVAKLRALAHTDGNTTYWSLETNTPFYGWGLAGRVETTALAVQALARSSGSEPVAVAPGSSDSSERIPINQVLTTPTNAKDEASDTGGPIKTSPANQTNDHLVRSGLLFLIKEKDRYGVWYSTQATINVLDAMLLLLQRGSPDRGAPPPSNSQNVAEIIVNEQAVQAVPMPPPNQFGNPIIVDISRFLRAARNRIEVRRAPNSLPASVQAVVTYYVPWSASSATKDASARVGESSGLRLIAKFDRTAGKVGEEISCHVEVERVGFRGYGMMLAEIGLPPGADVDRASLETAMKSSGWAMSQYDILPDRVVVYLWPPAGGVKFDFKFRPRFGLKAQTASSLIYDYYNPEARAVVAPTKFIVK